MPWQSNDIEDAWRPCDIVDAIPNKLAPSHLLWSCKDQTRMNAALTKSQSNEDSHDCCLRACTFLWRIRPPEYRPKCPKLRQRHLLRSFPDLHEQHYRRRTSGTSRPSSPSPFLDTFSVTVAQVITLFSSSLAPLSPTLFAASTHASPAPLRPPALRMSPLNLVQ